MITFFTNRFEQLLEEENLKPKYEMRVIHIPNKGNNIYTATGVIEDGYCNYIMIDYLTEK